MAAVRRESTRYGRVFLQRENSPATPTCPARFGVRPRDKTGISCTLPPATDVYPGCPPGRTGDRFAGTAEHAAHSVIRM